VLLGRLKDTDQLYRPLALVHRAALTRPHCFGPNAAIIIEFLVPRALEQQLSGHECLSGLLALADQDRFCGSSRTFRRVSSQQHAIGFHRTRPWF
jgi:hypothetical protein